MQAPTRPLRPSAGMMWDAGAFYIDILACEELKTLAAERRSMAQVHIIGRVTADLEMQTSQSKKPYIRFSIAETVGYNETAKTQYAQVWAFGQHADHLMLRKVRKGSLLRVSGSLELEEFTKQDGITADKRLKVKMESWGYVDAGKPKKGLSGDDTQPDKEPDSPAPDGVIDGERDHLPE